MSKLDCIILAAGEGSRMQSNTPKVLHKLGDKYLLERVVCSVSTLPVEKIYIVYNPRRPLVKDALVEAQPTLDHLTWITQHEARGTGHAVKCVIESAAYLPQDNRFTVILYGDVPLITPQTIQSLITSSQQTGVGLITAIVSDPTGYGRIIRCPQTNTIKAIVEHKDATDEQRLICEVNTGIYCVRNDLLAGWLPQIQPNAKTNEYYLTDIIEMANDDGIAVASLPKPLEGDAIYEIKGVNTQEELKELAQFLQANNKQD